MKESTKLEEKELDTLHAEWLERRMERDLQSSIRLQNYVTWITYILTDGVK